MLLHPISLRVPNFISLRFRISFACLRLNFILKKKIIILKIAPLGPVVKHLFLPTCKSHIVILHKQAHTNLCKLECLHPPRHEFSMEPGM